MKRAFASIFAAGRRLAVWTAAIGSLELTTILRRDTPFLWPWTVEGFVGTLAFVGLFFVNWLLGMLGALVGWNTGRRRGWPEAGALAGALGFWLGIGLWWMAAFRRGPGPLMPLGMPLPLLMAWAVARWGPPVGRRLVARVGERHACFRRWFAARMLLRRPRAASWMPDLDLRGVAIGVAAGLIVDALAVTGAFDYTEAVSLASRVRLRNEALISPWGVVEWARLVSLHTRGLKPMRRPQSVLVDLDDASVARIIAGSSEPRLQRKLVDQFEAWGVRRVVLPVARTRPIAAGAGWLAPRPELDEAAYGRMVKDLPLLIEALRRCDCVLLCVLPDRILPFPGPNTRVSDAQSLPTVIPPALFAHLLRSARAVGSADLDFFHVRQLPRLLPADREGRRAVPYHLTRRPRNAPELPASGLLINVFGSAPGALFPHVSVTSVLQRQPIYDRVLHRWVQPAEFFRGRIVFLDTLRQPIYDTPVGQFTTTELLAMATDNLLTGSLLIPPGRPLQFLLMLIVAGLVGSLSMRRSPLRASLRLIAVAGIYIVTAVGLFIVPGLWVPIVPILFAAVLAYLLVAQLVYSADESELERQRSERMRMDQELAIGREIQMSLLPFGETGRRGDGERGSEGARGREGDSALPSLAPSLPRSLAPSLSVSPSLRVSVSPSLPLPEGQFLAEFGPFVVLGRSEPAREVGGDFYDVFPVTERVGVVLGDVAGKGVPGALYMAVTTTLLQAYARLLAEPDEVLARANEELYPKMRGGARGGGEGSTSTARFGASGGGLGAPTTLRAVPPGAVPREGARGREGERAPSPSRLRAIPPSPPRASRRAVTFVSAFYGLLDPATGRLRGASAGQVPPLLVDPDGEARYLPLRGVPLGAFPVARYECLETDLEPGAALVLASDGFIEAAVRGGGASGGALGYDRFRDLVARHACHAHGDASACADGIFTDFYRQIGSDAERDDLTLLIIARSG